MIRRAAVLAALLLSACSTGPSRQDVLAALVGRTEADAIRTLGAPAETIKANGRTFLAFRDSTVAYAPVSPFYGPGFGYGFGYYGGAVPYVRGCETTLEVANGRVVGWTLRGAC